MRCIRELLYNAAKYSDGEHITLRITEKTACFNFIVEDIGPGLPDNAEELINKPFNKIDELSEGLGVGLPLTKRHSMAMGGDLIYDNTYHDGCRFIIEMPK
jgi:signal transduction histidine kinase